MSRCVQTFDWHCKLINYNQTSVTCLKASQSKVSTSIGVVSWSPHDIAVTIVAQTCYVFQEVHVSYIVACGEVGATS